MTARYQVLTAQGRGAIAVIELRGPGALAVADSVFRPHRGRRLSETAPGRLRLGRAGVGVGDEVVAVRIDDEPPVVEIHCHGGAAAVAAVVEALERAGALLDDRDRSLFSGAEDSIRAQAMADLAGAPTLRAAEILLDQVHGALSRAVADLIAQARAGGPPGRILDGLDLLIGRAGVGIRLLEGWKVVIAGRPNVGKSRLFNALAGYDRSIVDPRPGVTRDVVSVRTAFAGWPVELCDTAGEREGMDAVERLGIGRARQERRDADLVLLVLDQSEPLQEVDRDLLREIGSALVVANKSDLPPAWGTRELEQDGRRIAAVSAETGAGVDALVRAIESRLVLDVPPTGCAVPFRAEQLQALEEARARRPAGDLDGFVRRLEQIGGCPPGSGE